MAKKIDGMMLKEMFSSGAALLTQNRESVDALNVFPVPDGDTGTNMTQTITSAIREMNSKRYTSVSDVADAVARGALKGAGLRRTPRPTPAAKHRPSASARKTLGCGANAEAAPTLAPAWVTRAEVKLLL